LLIVSSGEGALGVRGKTSYPYFLIPVQIADFRLLIADLGKSFSFNRQLSFPSS